MVSPNSYPAHHHTASQFQAGSQPQHDPFAPPVLQPAAQNQQRNPVMPLIFNPATQIPIIPPGPYPTAPSQQEHPFLNSALSPESLKQQFREQRKMQNIPPPSYCQQPLHGLQAPPSVLSKMQNILPPNYSQQRPESIRTREWEEGCEVDTESPTSALKPIKPVNYQQIQCLDAIIRRQARILFANKYMMGLIDFEIVTYQSHIPSNDTGVHGPLGIIAVLIIQGTDETPLTVASRGMPCRDMRAAYEDLLRATQRDMRDVVGERSSGPDADEEGDAVPKEGE